MKRCIVLMIGLALGSAAVARDTTPAPALTEADREVLTRIVIDTWASHVEGAQQQRWRDHVEARAQRVPLAWLETAAAALDLKSAELALDGTAPLDNPQPAAFGSAGGNLVFTPVTPCRILDTRQPSPLSGPITGYTDRSFYGYAVNFQSMQGGANSDCGLPSEVAPEALAVTLAAVNPSADGYLTAYPVGSDQPLAASLNYIGGQVTATGLILPINEDLDVLEFVIYSRRDAHVVADVTGYFSRPEATALECTILGGNSVLIPAGGSARALSPTCPTGYAGMLGGCMSDSSSAILYEHAPASGGSTSCFFRNPSASSISVNADAYCCRIPGR